MADDDRTPTANITPFGLRMQPELKAKVEASARENNRSMNAEIVDRLQKSFPTVINLDDFAETVTPERAAAFDELMREFAAKMEKQTLERIARMTPEERKRLLDTGD